MTDEATNLIMEQLHILRRGVEGRRAELAEVKTRITGFEGTMGMRWRRSATCNHKSPFRPVGWIGLMAGSIAWTNGSNASSDVLICPTHES
jgi:hypothetical protein